MSSDHKAQRLFHRNPQRGAEYFGEITRISILLGPLIGADLSEEAGSRARIAATFGKRVLRNQRRKLR